MYTSTHSVRPDQYGRIDNLYTATVYEKGAELIRMLRLMIGDAAFFAGMTQYFDTMDGTAATIEDFIASFQPHTSHDLQAFSRWYAQAGTPALNARGSYDAASRQYRLTLTQMVSPTPGQPDKTPVRMPMRVALFDDNGAKLETRLDGGAALQDHVVVLETASNTFVFSDVASPPRPSLNRGFSAPVRLSDDLSEADRAALAGVDDDPFAQWEALQAIARPLILDAVRAGGKTPDRHRLDAFVTSLGNSVRRAAPADPAYAALLLYLPTVGELVMDVREADPGAIHDVRLAVRVAIAAALEPLLLDVLAKAEPSTFDPSAAAAGRRALRASALSLLSTLGDRHEMLVTRGYEAAAKVKEGWGRATSCVIVKN